MPKREPTLNEYRRLRQELAATRRDLKEAQATVRTLEEHENDLLCDMDDVWNAMSKADRDEQCVHPQEPPAP